MCGNPVRHALRAALVQPEQNQFKPDWNTEAVLVEEMQRMAKQIAEMKDWEAVASDQAMTIALLRSEQTTVTCQIYGPVFGACVACNKHIVQEAVAWFHLHNCEAYFTTEPSEDMVGNYWTPLYTSPPQRQPLTFD